MKKIRDTKSIDDDYFSWLQEWYKSQCNEEWEHSYGITISTLDNPGWSLRIELNDTIYSERIMNMIEFNTDANADDDNWYRVYTEDNSFYGFGGPEKLIDLIKHFKQFITS